MGRGRHGGLLGGGYNTCDFPSIAKVCQDLICFSMLNLFGLRGMFDIGVGPCISSMRFEFHDLDECSRISHRDNLSQNGLRLFRL